MSLAVFVVGYDSLWGVARGLKYEILVISGVDWAISFVLRMQLCGVGRFGEFICLYCIVCKTMSFYDVRVAC